MSSETAADLFFGPFDYARRKALAWLSPVARPFVVRRDLRVAAMGSFAVLFALVTAAFVPLWSLALGPLVLGVPHVVSDLRYLWVRPGFSKRPEIAVAVGLPLLVGGATGRCFWGLIAAAFGLLASSAGGWRKALGSVALLPLIVASAEYTRITELIFAHAHNLIAIGLWWYWSPRQKGLRLLPLAAFAVAGVALLLGAFDFVQASLGPYSGPLPAMQFHAARLAPFANATWAPRVVVFFAFAQSVHYGVWLRLIPDEDRKRATPRTFRASYRALASDLGSLRMVVAIGAALALACFALVSMLDAQRDYFRFAAFHGQLELAALALFWGEGRSRLEEPCRAALA